SQSPLPPDAPIACPRPRRPIPIHISRATPWSARLHFPASLHLILKPPRTAVRSLPQAACPSDPRNPSQASTRDDSTTLAKAARSCSPPAPPTDSTSPTARVTSAPCLPPDASAPSALARRY